MGDINDAQAGCLSLVRNKEDAAAVWTLLNCHSLAPIPVVIQVLLADQQHILLLSLFLRVNGHEETSGREKESEEKNEPRNRVDNVPEIRWQSC
jgi:hypothetical protein